ncbi:SIS domain-containing protein [Candidatus Pelagibacter sp.]|jgi:D-sedoheptulose 7-phosphate isomerase|nr:SIS domain-containing protein [Candidatus Pelagibacter sp.]|tara:strand:+ start:173 stop:763 length:591 start_codon:yes stop_codon:yes gene_type:complete
MSKIAIELQNQLNENIIVHKNILKMSKDIIDVIKNINKKLKRGGKILFCGNGGSAADAQHLAAEFIVRLRPHVNRNPIPAITLAQDTSTLTACGNDYSFDDIFLRPFKALVKKDDILICISTSGNSKNILKVLKEAKKEKIYSVCFLGKGGGKAKKMCSKPLVISSDNTARIQECHIFLGHFILEKVEDLIISKRI